MKLVMIRHGETNYNVEGLVNSFPTKKVHLTEKGIKQAEEVALKLKDYNFDIIIISEFFRTEQTASIINKYHLKPMFIDERINEHNLGVDGIPLSEYQEKAKQFTDWKTGKLEGGESHLDVKRRVFSFMDELKKKKQFNQVLVVTHLAILRLIKAYIKNISDDEFEKIDFELVDYDNCEFDEFEI